MKYILEIERMDGEDTTIFLENEGQPVDSLFSIISVGPDGAGIIDNGYRSITEAKQAWPEAIVPKPALLSPTARAKHYTISGVKYHEARKLPHPEGWDR